MPISPNIDVANDFFHDCIDLLQRYRMIIDHFSGIRSKRLKTFIDLRIAAECLLKSYVAYFKLSELDRGDVIKKIETYGHKITSMAVEAEGFADHQNWASFSPYVAKLDILPVGLRYRLDVFDFREVNEVLYYETVGNDAWLYGLHDSLKALSDDMNQHLNSHSCVVSVEELWEELITPRHNKYAKKKT